MPNLPNPWFATCPQVAEEAAASPVITSGPVDAAAEPFDGADIPMTVLMRRGFDPEQFLADCEEAPLFLRAAQIRPIVEVLAGYAR